MDFSWLKHPWVDFGQLHSFCYSGRITNSSKKLSMLKGILALLIFQGIGESIVYLGGLPIPGPVIGMVLLFLTLQVRGKKTPEFLKVSSSIIIDYLYLLLIPTCVGCFFLVQNHFSQWIYIVASIFISTLATIALGGLLMKYTLTRYELKSRIKK